MANYPLGQVEQFGLLQELGVGPSGTVYLCEHIQSGGQYVFKVFNASLVNYPDEFKCFMRELHKITLLSEPSIVSIMHAGVIDNPAWIHHGAPYYVVEAGEKNLEQYTLGRIVSQDEFISCIVQIATGLQCAHSKGIIHQNVKETNILIRKGTVCELMLTDFGLTITRLSIRSERLYENSTYAYMAKEMFQEKPRLASDQYSLAVVAYHLLSGGKDPYGIEKESATKKSYRYYHTLGKPIPFAQQGITTVPLAVEQAIFRALSSDYQQRFPTIIDFSTAIKAAYGYVEKTLIIGCLGYPPGETMTQICPSCNKGGQVIKASLSIASEYAYEANMVIRERLKPSPEPTLKSSWGVGSVITMIFLCLLTGFFLLGFIRSAVGPSASNDGRGYLLFFLGFLIACITFGRIKHKRKMECMQQLASARNAWSQEMQDYEKTYFCKGCEKKFLVEK